MHEKLIQSLRAEKKDMEARVEDLIARHEILISQKAEDHHNTVKYFEGVVA